MLHNKNKKHTQKIKVDLFKNETFLSQIQDVKPDNQTKETLYQYKKFRFQNE